MAVADSPYRIAIEDTARILECRAGWYRRQVITVVLLGVAVVVVSAVARVWAGLAGMILLLPVIGWFLYGDQRLMEVWREGILARWASGELELAGLRESVYAHPRLPRNTLEGMLQTLPSAGDLTAEQQVLPATRAAVAAVTRALHAQRARAALLKTTATGLAVCAALAALWLESWIPLVALAAPVFQPVAGSQRRGPIIVAAWAQVDALRFDPGFCQADFNRLLGSVK